MCSRDLARVVGLAVVSAISSGLFLLADSQEQDPPRIRAGIDLVHFDVTVTDKTGTLVEGLTADDFEVLENGARQSLSVFAAGHRDAAPDLHLGILIDVSGSMGPLENVRYITLEVLNRLPEAAGYTLIIVGNDARVTRFARGDFATLVERVRRITRRDSESTALWDGFRSYLGAVTEQPGRHALVVFTDGRDTASTATFQHVLRAFRGSAVTVFSVDFGEARGSAHELQLRQISEETGGVMMFAYTRNQMDDVYRRIVGEVRSQYGLGYVSTDPRQDGRWRDVTIRLVRPEHKELRLRTRAGYYAAKAAKD
jgi:VWFA-related protein